MDYASCGLHSKKITGRTLCESCFPLISSVASLQRTLHWTASCFITLTYNYVSQGPYSHVHVTQGSYTNACVSRSLHYVSQGSHTHVQDLQYHRTEVAQSSSVACTRSCSWIKIWRIVVWKWGWNKIFKDHPELIEQYPQVRTLCV
jgi:hypothetical protein